MTYWNYCDYRCADCEHLLECHVALKEREQEMRAIVEGRAFDPFEAVKESFSEAKEMIKQEQEYGAFDVKKYKDFMNEIKMQRSKFLQRVHKIKQEGVPIIAVGAAAKGNTFLNFYKLDGTLIDYVTDASPHKKGKYTPATRIPIVGDEIFSKFDKVYALILSWNIANQLKEKLAPLNKNIQFISPEENI